MFSSYNYHKWCIIVNTGVSTIRAAAKQLLEDLSQISLHAKFYYFDMIIFMCRVIYDENHFLSSLPVQQHILQGGGAVVLK